MDEFESILLEEEGQYLKLNDIGAYKIAFHLSNFIWERVVSWGYFEKDTVGKQFVRAVDSISANIAEGFGRYGKKEKIQLYFSRITKTSEGNKLFDQVYERET